MATNLTKFFRKYNKAMLAIFTVGLMIAFLVPTTLKEVFNTSPGKQVIGRAFGKKVYREDLARAYQGIEILRSLNQMLQQGQTERNQQAFNVEFLLQFSPENEKLVNYYLLIEEARKLGIEISVAQADQALVDRKIPAEVINAMIGSRESQISLNDLRRAVADYLMVESALELAISSVKTSDPELVNYYRQTGDRMIAQIIPVPASEFVKSVADPSAKDLQAYFDANKAKFEYPDRVAVEYLEADLDRIKETLTVSRERARKEWEENKADYTTTTMPATAPGQPPASQPVQVPMTFEQAMPKAIDNLKNEKARELALTAMRVIRERADQYWQSAAVDNKTGLKTKPEKVADFQQLADQVSKEYGVKIVYHRTPLISKTEAANLPGIGQSFTPEGRQMLYFSDYAFRIAPFYQPPDRRSGEAESLFLAPYQDSVRMDQMTGYRQYKGLYVFRVIDTSAKHLPANLDEVKDKVQNAYKLEKADAIARNNAETICQAAGKQTLADLVKKPADNVKNLLAALKVKDVTPETFARRAFSYGAKLNPPMVRSVGGDATVFADNAFEKLWNQPTTQPDGVRSCAVIGGNDQVAYVVQLEEKKPATAEDFKQYKFYIARMVLMGYQQEFLKNWLDSKNIHQRAEYVPQVSKDEIPN